MKSVLNKMHSDTKEEAQNIKCIKVQRKSHDLLIKNIKMLIMKCPNIQTSEAWWFFFSVVRSPDILLILVLSLMNYLLQFQKYCFNRDVF